MKHKARSMVEACQAHRLRNWVERLQRWRIDATGFTRIRSLSYAARSFSRPKRVPAVIRAVAEKGRVIELLYDKYDKTVRVLPFWEHLG